MNQKNSIPTQSAMKKILDFMGPTGKLRAPMILVIGDRPKQEVQTFLRTLLEHISSNPALSHIPTEKTKHFSESDRLLTYLKGDRMPDPIVYWDVDRPLIKAVQSHIATQSASGHDRHFAPPFTIIVMKEKEAEDRPLHSAFLSCVGARVIDIAPPLPRWEALTRMFKAMVARSGQRRGKTVQVDPQAESLLRDALRTTKSDDQREVQRLVERCSQDPEASEGRISGEILLRHLPDRYREALEVPALAPVH